MGQQNWFEHFKHKLQGLTPAFEMSDGQLSLLCFALKNSYLNQQDYLDWASNYFGLPLLKPDFFVSNPQSSDFFSKWSSIFPWSIECLPVAEWDGSLIVASLQPPEQLPDNHKFIFVLTSLEQLEATWHNLQDSTSLEISQPPPPDGLILENIPMNSSRKSPESTFSFEDLNADNTNYIESLDLGVNFTVPPLVMNELSVGESTEIAPLQKKKPSLLLDPPNLEIEEQTFISKNLDNDNNAVLDGKIKSIFDQMKVHFEKAMILSIDKNETKAVVVAWDSGFDGKNKEDSIIPLKTPSMFNIVAATSKPYHGYVSLNDINEKFFETWNHGDIPDHVTIVPILFQEKLVGMLMGFADKSAYNKASLTLAEKLSTQFLMDLEAA
jgi:hypothetical protein